MSNKTTPEKERELRHQLDSLTIAEERELHHIALNSNKSYLQCLEEYVNDKVSKQKRLR